MTLLAAIHSVKNSVCINELEIIKLVKLVKVPNIKTYNNLCLRVVVIFKIVVKSIIQTNASKKASGIERIFVKNSFGVVNAVQID